MIKRLFLVLAVVLVATTAVAQITLGESCENPIPVDENYEGTVDGPCELWYTAYTYDLPLNVHFIPDNQDSKRSPAVEIDLTCEAGVYDDPKLDSLINLVDDYNVSFPIELRCDKSTVNGIVEWDLSVNKSYREQLAEFGVPYNVQAFIKVTYYESGRITLKPDLTFKNCMESAEYINLGDTIDVVANDVDRVFVFPYTDWQEDSIRFVWTGDQPADIYLAVQKCDFEPVATNDFVKMNYSVSNKTPKKLYSGEMKAAIKDYANGGLFYAKVLAGVSGRLVVEKLPMSTAQGGAILMEYGKTIQLAANDTNQLYCFPRTWKATQFQSTTDFGITMYLSNTSDFTTSEGDANVLDCFVASAVDNERYVYISNKEMNDLVVKAKDDYIYVRFRCAAAVLITPEAWAASDCAGDSYLIKPNEPFSIKANNPNIIYRMRYDDYVGYDLKIKWGGEVTVTPYIADTCRYTLSTTSKRLVLRPATGIKKRSSYTVDSATLDSWASRVDSEGYLYMRFKTTSAGKITLQTEKPLPVDPEVNINPCVVNSMELKSGVQIPLDLNSAFTIYRINYAEWVAKDNKLAWSGSESLHTFVAETCEFAVAPYNKYVVNYVVVPAAGEYVLDVATLTQYADKVDADGYLYIRFLTEKEGTLSVTSY